MMHLATTGDTLSRLKTLLGAESGSSWIEFMDYTSKTLSDVLASGKPKKSAIENSLIGQLGFSSWKEMIEAPIEKNGLAWNLGAWNAWKRAYRLILKYDYLRTAELSHSQINTIYNETKPDFPESYADCKDYLQERTDKQKYKHQNSLKTAQAQVHELQQQIDSLNGELALKSQENDDKQTQLDKINPELTEANKNLGEMTIKLEQVDKLEKSMVQQKTRNNALVFTNNEYKRVIDEYNNKNAFFRMSNALLVVNLKPKPRPKRKIKK